MGFRFVTEGLAPVLSAREQKRTIRERIDTTRAICLVLAVLAICYLLYSDALFPCSISTVWETISRFVRVPHFQLVTVGLLPVYVALMVFGAAFFGAFAGGYIIRALYRWLRSDW